MTRLNQGDESRNGFIDETLVLLPDIAEGIQRYVDYSALIQRDLDEMNEHLNGLMKAWRSMKVHVQLQEVDARQDRAEWGKRIQAMENEASNLALFGYGYVRPTIHLASLELDMPETPA